MSGPRHYPRREGTDLIWACCESSIGPPCQHVSESRIVPTEDQIMAEAEARANMQYDHPIGDVQFARVEADVRSDVANGLWPVGPYIGCDPGCGSCAAEVSGN